MWAKELQCTTGVTAHCPAPVLAICWSQPEWPALAWDLPVIFVVGGYWVDVRWGKEGMSGSGSMKCLGHTYCFLPHQSSPRHPLTRCTWFPQKTMCPSLGLSWAVCSPLPFPVAHGQNPADIQMMFRVISSQKGKHEGSEGNEGKN